MKNFSEAVLAYLKAQDARQTQVALDAMTPAIKADVVATIEEVIAATQSGNDPAKHATNIRVKLAAENLLREIDDSRSTDSLM